VARGPLILHPCINRFHNAWLQASEVAEVNTRVFEESTERALNSQFFSVAGLQLYLAV